MQGVTTRPVLATHLQDSTNISTNTQDNNSVKTVDDVDPYSTPSNSGQAQPEKNIHTRPVKALQTEDNPTGSTTKSTAKSSANTGSQKTEKQIISVNEISKILDSKTTANNDTAFSIASKLRDQILKQNKYQLEKMVNIKSADNNNSVLTLEKAIQVLLIYSETREVNIIQAGYNGKKIPLTAQILEIMSEYKDELTPQFNATTIVQDQQENIDTREQKPPTYEEANKNSSVNFTRIKNQVASGIGIDAKNKNNTSILDKALSTLAEKGSNAFISTLADDTEIIIEICNSKDTALIIKLTNLIKTNLTELTLEERQLENAATICKTLIKSLSSYNDSDCKNSIYQLLCSTMQQNHTIIPNIIEYLAECTNPKKNYNPFLDLQSSNENTQDNYFMLLSELTKYNTDKSNILFKQSIKQIKKYLQMNEITNYQNAKFALQLSYIILQLPEDLQNKPLKKLLKTDKTSVNFKNFLYITLLKYKQKKSLDSLYSLSAKKLQQSEKDMSEIIESNVTINNLKEKITKQLEIEEKADKEKCLYQQLKKFINDDASLIINSLSQDSNSLVKSICETKKEYLFETLINLLNVKLTDKKLTLEQLDKTLDICEILINSVKAYNNKCKNNLYILLMSIIKTNNHSQVTFSISNYLYNSIIGNTEDEQRDLDLNFNNDIKIDNYISLIRKLEENSNLYSKFLLGKLNPYLEEASKAEGSKLESFIHDIT